MTIDRRRILAGAGVAALLAAFGLTGGVQPAAAQSATAARLLAPAASPLPERVLGQPNAPVTVIEYASATCSHCADYHAETFPALKAKYIDTGKVRYIFREFPLDSASIAAFMLARCLPQDKYFPMISTLFETQKSWAFSQTQDPFTGLLTVARQAGMSQAEFERCLSDKTLATNIREGVRYANQELGVNATPTFFINGKMVSGAMGLDKWDAELQPLLGGK